MAGSNLLGDLNGDGVVDIRDLVLLINHINGTAPLPAAVVPYADLDQDGLVDQQDVNLEANLVLGLASPVALPLAHVVQTSPANGEGEVSVTRPTLFKLSMPLSATAVVTTNQVYATFGGRHLLSWVEVSADRKTVTLFYQEPMPGAARIRVLFDGMGLIDFLGRPVALAGDGVPGGQVIVDFDTLNNNPLSGTIVAGRVFASELATQGTNEVNQPLAGVTITVDGQEEMLRAVTDQFGNFRLDPAPAGPFFVHIDGRTATNGLPEGGYPNGPYYPYVGKEWVGSPGEEVNIGNVYLPLIAAGTLQDVSPTQPTSITFPSSVLAAHPELTGVTLNVPPNALFSDDGTRGGRVGIAPVPPDRLPSPLPYGLQFSLVITVQTDGPLNFDQPVPACFPNLPDPTTGQVLPPGAKSALWSFNHRDGQWEIQGPMTVSADGKLVCTDPGVGISFPGWHGTRPNSTASGGPLDAGGGADGPFEPGNTCPAPGDPNCDCKSCKTDAHGRTDPVNYFSGEFYLELEDLRIKGRGLDFTWGRKYRSRVVVNTAQGNGWDYSYNISIAAQGQDMVLRDGNTRADLYQHQPDGTWGPREFFRQLVKNADGTFSLVFEDNGQWNFYGLDGSAQAGRIQAIVDRNNNQLAFQYDALGRISQIIDTLDRPFTVSYNPAGFISQVTDFAGRSVRYEYYGTGEAGGSLGDLKAVISPVVTNTPTGNDFPDGKRTTYTYTSGFADENLNHNLLTITDGRRNDPNDPTFGQGPYLVNVYASTTDPADYLYDKVVQQSWGGDRIDLTYVPMLPSNPNGNCVAKTIVRDRNGNVLELFYDQGNRLVRERQYTGRADTNAPTTELSNRPTGKLRPTDPDYFETLTEYNADSQPTRVIHPNGNITEYVYESDLNSGASARARGNLRILRRLPGTHQPAGDQAVIEEQFEYDTDFNGCCGFNFVTRHVDGRGNVTLYSYDNRGNRIHTQHRIASIVEDWEYNEFGQLTAHVGPDNGSDHRRRDEYTYYTNGPQQGYLQMQVIDAPGFALTTTYEYDLVGNVVRTIDPRGHDSLMVVNALDQVVRSISREVQDGSGVRYQNDSYYDANNNLTRFDVQNLDEQGVLQTNTYFTSTFEHEILNRIIRQVDEVDRSHSVVMEHAYDGNRNRVLTRFGEATAGRQTNNAVFTVYDERDLVFRRTRGPGDPLQSTTQTDYDANGSIVAVREGLENGPHLTTIVQDGYDRAIQVADAMGNVRTSGYDPNGNQVHVQTDGELVDLPGSAANLRLQEATFAYDAMDRMVQTAAAFFDPQTQAPFGDGQATTRTTYSDNSQVIAFENENHHTASAAYDTANRLALRNDQQGNTTAYAYDSNNNVVAVTRTDKSDLGAPDEVFVTRAFYDNLDRLAQMVDNGGNTLQFAYDSRNNRVLTTDALTNRVRYSFDGLNRQIGSARFLTDNGTGSGNVVGSIVIRWSWDDSSRLVAQTDDATNVTSYVYDSLDRRTATVYADGTSERTQFDVHDNPVVVNDGNSNVVTSAYDLLNRLVHKSITVGPGVAPTTTFEEFKYDGLSRLVYAANDGSVVTRGFNSLSRPTREVQNGQPVLTTFDGAGDLTSCTYPSGRVLTTTFDELERRQTIQDTNGLIARYYYVGPDRVTQRDYGNGTRANYQYDGISGVTPTPGDFGVRRIIGTKHSLVSDNSVFDDRAYTWDRMENKSGSQDLSPGQSVMQHSYTYDSAYRLIRSDKALSGGVPESVRYFLDSVGNWTNVLGGTNAGLYTLGLATPGNADRQMNQYTSTPRGSLSYDSNGNLIAADNGQRRFTYDYRNRMATYTNAASGTASTYAYDALGRRIRKVFFDASAHPTVYFYTGWQVCEEQNDAGVTLSSFVYGRSLDEVLSMRSSGHNFYFHADDQLSVRKLTDESSRVVESYDYQDYGAASVFAPDNSPRSGSAVGNPYLFNGCRFDQESGLIYCRTRYLEPRIGRFTTRDVIGVWGDTDNLGNAQTYVADNPLSRSDAFGFGTWRIFESLNRTENTGSGQKLLDKIKDDVAGDNSSVEKRPSEDTILDALRNTTADDVLVYHGHGVEDKAEKVVTLATAGFGGAPIETNKFAEAATNAQGVVILMGCQTCDLVKKFSAAKCVICFKEKVAVGFAGDFLDKMGDELKKTKGDLSWDTLVSRLNEQKRPKNILAEGAFTKLWATGKGCKDKVKAAEQATDKEKK